jgi:cytochrome b561
MVDYARSLTFITEDDRWMEKLGIGTVVLIVSFLLSFILIGLVGFLIVAGYCVRLLQNVRDGNPRPLPEWDQWGDDLIRGFKLVVVTIVWALPSIILSIPLGIGNAILTRSDDPTTVFGTMVVVCASCLVGLYGLFLAVIMPGYTIAYARDEQISSGVEFSRIIEWTRQNLGQVAVATIVYLIAGFVIGLAGLVVGALLCLIGLVVTVPLSTLVTYLFQSHLYGQLARVYPMSGGLTSIPPGGDITPPDETPLPPVVAA